MSQRRPAALLTSFSLALVALLGCSVSQPANESPAADASVIQRANAYPQGGYPRPAKDYTSVDGFRYKTIDGYVITSFDVRGMTAPIADFRGPDLLLRSPNPWWDNADPYYSGNNYGNNYGNYSGRGGGRNRVDGDSADGFNPYFGIDSDFFYFLDRELDLIPYLKSGLEYAPSPYDRAKERREASILETIVGQTGGNSWKTDPNVRIQYANGLLVIKQKEAVLDEIEFLITLLRASPGK